MTKTKMKDKKRKELKFEKNKLYEIVIKIEREVFRYKAQVISLFEGKLLFLDILGNILIYNKEYIFSKKLLTICKNSDKEGDYACYEEICKELYSKEKNIVIFP